MHHTKASEPEGKGIEFLGAARVCREAILVIRRNLFCFVAVQLVPLGHNIFNAAAWRRGNVAYWTKDLGFESWLCRVFFLWLRIIPRHVSTGVSVFHCPLSMLCPVLFLEEYTVFCWPQVNGDPQLCSFFYICCTKVNSLTSRYVLERENILLEEEF